MSANEGLAKYAEGTRDSETFNTQITVRGEGKGKNKLVFPGNARVMPIPCVISFKMCHGN